MTTTDPLEIHFSKYRQMSGGCFLVSLCDVQNSERILAIDKLLKEGINFWEENLQPDDMVQCESMNAVNKEIENISNELHENQLSDDSMEVAVTIAGYIATKLSSKSKCPECSKRMIASNGDIAHSEYLKTLSRGGLTSPTPMLSDFVCHSFSILDTISPIILKHSSSLSMRNTA